jgi:hypothetical protein
MKYKYYANKSWGKVYEIAIQRTQGNSASLGTKNTI